MKKINSIGYAHKIIGFAGLFIVPIPFCCYLLNLALLMNISLAIGFLILLFFVGLLGIEFHQDKKINRQYIGIRETKLALSNGSYECQSCGNREVVETDKCCGICGITFNTGTSLS